MAVATETPRTAGNDTSQPAPPGVVPAPVDGLTLRQQGWLINALGLLVLLMVSLAFAALYVSREKCFYSWDLAGYQTRAIEQLTAYQQSFAEGWRLFLLSLRWDYNYLFVQPMLPFLRLLGTSRMPFILSLALLYQVPYLLALGGVVGGLAESRRRMAFWWGVGVAFLVPITWAPLLRGYPDAGGAAMFALAIVLYLQDLRLRDWKRIVGIGVLLVGAAMFRRHFAYDVVAFGLCLWGHALVSLGFGLARNPRQALREFLKQAVRIVLLGVVMGLILATVGREFARNILAQDTTALYESYAFPPQVLGPVVASYYGGLLLALAAGGYVLGLICFPRRREEIAFVLALGACCAVVWLFLARQLCTQHTLHFTFQVVVGIALGGWALIQTLSRRRALVAVGAMTGILLLDFAAGVSTVRAVEDRPAIRPLFAMKHSPLQRADYREVCRLIAFLRQTVKPNERIYVAASSNLFNDDLLLKGEKQEYSAEDAQLQFLPSPHIDSWDWYPLENLLFGDYVVTAEPGQYCMGPDRQKVTGVVLQMFAEKWEMAADFKLLPEEFKLVNGATVRIYKRQHPTDVAVAYRTFEKIQKHLGLYPGRQREWLALNEPFPFPVSPAMPYSNHIGFEKEGAPAPNLLYTKVAPGEGTVRGTLTIPNGACRGARLRLSAIGGSGQTQRLVETRIDTAGKPCEFSLPYSGCGDRRLMLTLLAVEEKPGAANFGTVVLEAMQVQPKTVQR